MKRVTFFLLLAALAANAAPLSNTARTVIPSEVQQLIVVDYRSLNNNPTALALKERVLPPPLKQFETTLRGAGITPESDVEQLVFASFRGKDGLRFIGVAQGQFPGQKVLLRLRKQKIKGEKYHLSTIYPMGNGMSMTLLDSSNMIFGEGAVLKQALDARDGEARSLNANTGITDLMSSVEGEAVWSVLDTAGTQTMLKSALGTASELADYDMVKKRLKGSRYSMKFARGVDFDLDVVTADSITAATLSSLLKAGVMYRKATASEIEKNALENVEVRSDSNNLKMEFRTDDNKFQSLLNSDLFAAVSK